MHIMPVIGKTIRGRVLAHGRNADAVAKGDRTQFKRLEQMRGRVRILNHGKLVAQELESARDKSTTHATVWSTPAAWVYGRSIVCAINEWMLGSSCFDDRLNGSGCILFVPPKSDECLP